MTVEEAKDVCNSPDQHDNSTLGKAARVLVERVKELDKVVEPLHITLDGVYAIPSVTSLWAISDDNSIWSQGTAKSNGWARWGGKISECYSTREAAETARREQ